MASEYYAVEKNDAVYLAWTQDGDGHLQGQLEVVSVDSGQGTKLNTKSAAFTGIRSGSDVSLSFGILTAFGGTTWTGHVGWNDLTLIVPTNGVPQQVVLRAGSFAQFQEAAAKLQGSVAVNQQRAADQKAVSNRNAAIERAYSEALGHIKDGENSVNAGITQLNTVIPKDPPSDSLRMKYPAEWDKMQEVWHKEQAASEVTPMTCYQKSQVEYQASQVEYEQSQFDYLDTRADYVHGLYKSARDSILSGVAELQQWSSLTNARGRNYAVSVGKPYQNDAVAATKPFIEHGQAALDLSSSRWTEMINSFITLESKAKELDKEAKALPDSITCSG